jgi:hypothetical protein
MLQDLQESGFPDISKFHLVRIRKELGLYRWETEESWERKEAHYRTIIERELAKGILDSYGRGMLHAYFKGEGFNIKRYIRTIEFFLILTCY